MIMIHHLKPTYRKRKPKRIGRGGKRGTYSGRGQKGQKARAGRKIKSALKEEILKFPKLRGIKFKPLKAKPEIINLKEIEPAFENNEVVSPETLYEKKLIKGQAKKPPQKVKILGEGELTKSLIFKNCLVSEKAQKKILKAGGKIE